MVVVPPTFSRCTARQPFAVIASAGTKYCPPALLTRPSGPPWRSSAASTIAAAWSGSRMSPETVLHRSPINAAASSSTSARRPAMTTSAPQAASSVATARPRFVPPPVTIATRPSSASGAKISEAGGMPAGSLVGHRQLVGHRAHEQHAAVDDVRRAGHVARLRRGQPGDQLGYLARVAGPLQRDAWPVFAVRIDVLVLGHRRGDLARSDRVDTDSVLGELERELLGQPAKTVLGHDVGRRRLERHVLVDRGDVDDSPLHVVVDHVANRRLGHEKRAGQVDLEDVAPLVEGELEERG